jgi:hypothetical protein
MPWRAQLFQNTFEFHKTLKNWEKLRTQTGPEHLLLIITGLSILI